MQPFHPFFCYPALALAVATLPTLALAGPDAPTLVLPRRPAPPVVRVQQTDTITTNQEEDLPLQALRQREESVNYRIAYKLLNNVGLTGTEGDRKPVGYLQLSGPTPLLTYRRPAAPQPRRFPHFAELPEDKKPAAPEPRPSVAPAPEPAPVAVPGLPTSPTATPEDAPEAGILPDPAQQAAQGRNDEILSYFQRPNRAPGSPAGPSYGPIPAQNGNGGEPLYLQTPEQLPIPPSRATYRVVPK